MPADQNGQPGVAKVAVEDGSANVYADLGRPDADEMLVKAQLASRIGEVIERGRLTQVAVPRITGLPKTKLSGLLRGQFRGISEAKMLACLTRLGRAGTDRVEVLPG